MAGRRLRSRRFYCFGFDGNLQLSGQSLRSISDTDANSDAYPVDYTESDSYAIADCKTDSHTAAAPNTASASLTS